ncbi:MAG: hypothetical protein Q9216_002072 [Gyalolechia sp. 2 TL-2023]
MPGVPSGRACDACRQQKKKVKLSDSIDCTGHGQQRYKFVFQNQTPGLKAVHRPVQKSKAKPQENGRPQEDTGPQEKGVILRPARNPSNALSSLTSAFVHSIGHDVDIKFQLVWNFGGYLAGIPRRLGRSAALDAATGALVSAHAGFCTGDIASHSIAWREYSRALSVLRHDLNDKIKARSSESLCAVMVLSIVQFLIDPGSGDLVGHTEGAAQIVKSRGFIAPNDEFEKLLILTLRGPVVFDALLTDRIHFSSREWKTLNDQGPKTQVHPDGQWFECVAAVPDLIQRSRAAIKLHKPPSLHLLSLELETRSLLDDCKPLIMTFRERLEKYDPSSTPTAIRDHIHANHLRVLGLALGTGIILNCVLGALEGTSDYLGEESSAWSEEIVQLSQVARKYLPLGAMAMVICLRFAWVGAADTVAKEGVKALLYDYELACMGTTSDEGNCGDLNQDLRRFTLQDA